MISILDQWDLRAKKQNFARDAFDTIADMKAFSENYLPPIFDAYCYEDGKKYRYNASNEILEDTGKWRVIGEGGGGDLSSYYTKTETNNLLNDKVDKVSGKDLSTNDFTDAYKQQIDDNESAIETLNGDSTVVGSVDYKVANGVTEANTYTDTECAKKVDKVSGKQLSTEDYTSEEKAKLADLENYDDTALANRVTANEDAITTLNGDTTVNGSVDKKVATCLSDSKDYTDVSIQNAIRQTAIVCDAKPTISGTTITYYQDGVEKTITSDNKTKFYYTTAGVNYSTIWIENTEFTDTVASVNFSDYVSKTNDVTSTYSGSDADKTKIPNIGAMDALKTLVDTELADKFDTADIESSVSSSSDNPVSSSALYNKFAEKVDIAQGVANEGKILQVNSSGDLALVDPQSTIDFSDTVSKTNDLVSTYTGSEVDKTKVPTLASMDALKALVDTDINGKVSTAQGVANEGKILQVDSSGDLALVDVSAMGGDASGVSYTNSDFSTLDNVKKALDNLFAKVYYTKIAISSLSVSPSTTIYEIGNEISELQFAWNLNKTPITQTFNGTSVDNDVRAFTYDTPFSTNKSFKLVVSDGTESAEKSINIQFQNQIFYGSASIPQDYDSAFILGLSNHKFNNSTYKGSFNITIGNGEYGFVCCPKSWNIKSVCKIGGFDTELVKENAISFTNSSGGVVVYDIVRTTRSGLGSITMVFE
jgi:hypothetical protein